MANRDRVPHDPVLVATSIGARRLPTDGIRVDESDLRSEVNRTPRLAPGGSAVPNAAVAAGSAVLVCTVPHHVREQMAATLVVTH